jgi:hypothetical protein
MAHARRVLLSSFLAAGLLANAAFGQPATGGVKGTLEDESGAVIPAINVTLTGNGATKTAQSQADGSYSFTGLAPGQYTATVTLPGFQPFTGKVTVAAGATATLPIQLTVQAETQQVTVLARRTQPPSASSPRTTPRLSSSPARICRRCRMTPTISRTLCRRSPVPAPVPAAASSISTASAAANCRRKKPFARSASIRIPSRPNTTGSALAESKFSPSREPEPSTACSSSTTATPCSIRAIPSPPTSPITPIASTAVIVSGPINKKMSFFLDYNERDITNNAITYAIYLNPTTLQPSPVDTAVVTPQMNRTISPRLDYQINTNNTLTVRVEERMNYLNNAGLGGYHLPPQWNMVLRRPTTCRRCPKRDDHRDERNQPAGRKRNALPVLPQLDAIRWATSFPKSTWRTPSSPAATASAIPSTARTIRVAELHQPYPRRAHHPLRRPRSPGQRSK